MSQGIDTVGTHERGTMDELDLVFARLHELLETIPDPTGLRQQMVDHVCRSVADVLQVHVDAIEAAEFDDLVKRLDR
jgi:hypothetical protein